LAGYNAFSQNKLEKLDSATTNYIDSLYYLAEDFTATRASMTVFYSKQMLDTALSINDTNNTAWAYWELGWGYYLLNKLDSAELSYEKSLNLFGQLGDTLNQANVYSHLGRVYHFQGKYYKAIEFYELSEKYGEDDGRVYTNSYLGDIYEEQGNYDKALEYYRKSLNAIAQYSLREILGGTYNDLAYVFIKQSKLEDAKAYLELAFNENVKYRDSFAIAYTHNYYAEYLFLQNQYDSAIVHSSIATEIFKKYGDPYSLAYHYNTTAYIELRAGHHSKALQLVEKAFQIAKQERSRYLLKETSLVLSKAQEANNQFSKALKSLKLHKLYNDTIIKVSVEEKILERQNDFQEKENQLLEAQNLLQESRINRDKYILIYASTLLSLCILLVYLVYNNSKKHKEQNKRLLANSQEIKKQQTRISKQANELKLKNTELEKMDKTKNRLFSILSHDLREPFNQVSSLLELIKHDALNEEEKNNLLNKVQDSLASTSNSLDNLLHWSKNQLNGFKVDPEKINLLEIINEVKQQNELSLNHKDLGFKIDVPQNLILKTDRTQLIIILRNLINNAIKFSLVGESITVRAKELDDVIAIDVIDNGKGISPQKLKELQTLEENISTPGTLNEKGTGIGLMIIKEFLKANYGSLSVESEAGKGSTFTVILPKS
jgi:signal transduction histidine kinase